MQLTINIEKNHLIFFLIAIVVVMGAGLAVGYGTTNPSNFGHTPSEIDPGTFAGGGNYIFPDTSDVQVEGQLCLNDTCKSSWINFSTVCNNCGISSWWGKASSGGFSMTHPTCPEGYTLITEFTRVTYIQGERGETALRDVASANSCCVLCFKHV